MLPHTGLLWSVCFLCLFILFWDKMFLMEKKQERKNKKALKLEPKRRKLNISVLNHTD